MSESTGSSDFRCPRSVKTSHERGSLIPNKRKSKLFMPELVVFEQAAVSSESATPRSRVRVRLVWALVTTHWQKKILGYLTMPDEC